MELNRQQYEALKEAKSEIQDTPGVYQEMMGRSGGADQSGIAINSLVEQGTMTLAELNDNYRYARMLVGERLLALVKEDIGKREMTITVGKGTSVEKNVMINQLVTRDDGTLYRSNNLVRTRMSVELEDVPSTPTYRQQQMVQLTELTKSLPPEFQAAIADMVIEASDYPQRQKMAERIRGVNGQTKNPENMNEQEYQQYQAAQMEAQKYKAHEEEMMRAALEEAQGKAAKAKYEAEVAREKIDLTAAQTDKVEQEIDMAPTEATLDNAAKLKALEEEPEKPEKKPEKKPKKKGE